MTSLIYNEDAYITSCTATVMSCDKIKVNNKELFGVILDRTCFFPEQGGQTADIGIFSDLNGNKLADISGASIKNDIITHFSDSPVEAGTMITATIDFEKRFDKMQQHSGEHLVSGTVHSKFGYDNVGFHLSEREVTLDFNGIFTEEELVDIENTVNRAVFENFESHIFFPSSEELNKLEYRSKKELTGQVRIVEYPGYDICACCAPHVRRTGEIGLIKIIAAEHFKGGTRMWIECGGRALKSFDRLLKDNRAISRLLSVKPDETKGSVEKLYKEKNKLKSDIYVYKKTEFMTEAGKAAENGTNLIFTDTVDSGLAREAVNAMLANGAETGYCFMGNDETEYRFIIGSKSVNCRDIMTKLSKTLSVKGGGSPEMVQGTVTATKSDITGAIGNE